MATLHVQDFPDDVYEALRRRAKKNRTSIASEVTAVLRQFVPTAEESKRRKEFFKFVEEMGRRPSPGPGPFPSTEEMVREDRER